MPYSLTKLLSVFHFTLHVVFVVIACRLLFSFCNLDFSLVLMPRGKLENVHKQFAHVEKELEK